MTANRVLVVRVPAGWARAEDLPELAEYVGNAIVDGVLVLGESVRLELMELPPLGAVEVVAEPVPSLDTAKPKTELPDILPAEGVSRPEPKPPVPPPERPPAEKPKPAESISLQLPAQPKVVPKPVRETEPVFLGQAAIEKRRIHERLTRYWKTAGTGAMQRLADQIGWPVANVYGAQRAERFGVYYWRQLDRGMDALGFEMEGEK